MKTRLQVLESTAARTQAQAGAAWQDLLDGKAAGLTDGEMSGLVKNWTASRAMEVEAFAAYRAALAAA